MTESRASSRSASPPSFKERLKQRKKQMGRAVSPDPDDDKSVDHILKEEEEEGTTMLYKMPARMVTLHPGNVVRKSGKFVNLQEADALRIAAEAGLPVPHVRGTETTTDGKNHILMDYIQGQPLSAVWLGLSAAQKQDMARQLREILLAMRALPPPEAYVGDCTGDHILDTRLYFTHTSPSCRDEQGFNEFLLSGLFPKIPSPIRAAFAGRLRTYHHRIVFTHGDLAPRNIMVRDGKIMGIIDWEEAGWYPEYWEYVKFFQRSTTEDGDWRCHADVIFPQSYPDELVDHIAMSKWLSP